MAYLRTATRYAVVFTDALTGEVRGELPLIDVKQTEVLNLPGSLTLGMALDPRRMNITAETVAPWRTIVYLLRDDSVLGCGAFVLGHQMDVGGNSITLSCVGIGEYFRHRYLRQDLMQVGIDQALIVKALIDYAQAQSGGNIGVTTDYITATGVLRDRTDWFGYARKNIGGLIADLAAVSNGFNFRYRSRRSGQVYVTDLTTSYPATGRVTNHVFELGGNVEVMGATVDGKDMVNFAESIGGGNADAAPIGAATNADSLNTTPLLESVTTYSDISDPSTLLAKSQRDIVIGSDPVTLPTLRISPDGDPGIGQYVVGDRVRVRGSHGLLSLDADYLITQTSLVVGTAAEYVDVVTAPVLLFV
ncbi:hypothetical protein UFOVP1360_8 [uncultured Caudovirales phage]|uniref:Uncharacterized protein n=1 Tax=uncultured Caudovirales phage TaxID=2100421 RepID=A0A6J5RTY8_9CAUD|nr:hypothetical protein UFOVP1360_8 [uncultured Caudovirales phage]